MAWADSARHAHAPSTGGVSDWNRSHSPYFPLFAPDSTWNLRIPDNAAIDPHQDAYLDKLWWAMRDYGTLSINRERWTVPIWYADHTTLTHRVECTAGWGCGPGFGDHVPIPNEAIPDPEDDGHMVVVDLERGLAWEFWQAWQDESGWHAGYGIVFNISESPYTDHPLGVVQPVGHQSDPWATSARASGVSLLGGLIRYSELSAGRIDHALAFAYPLTRGDAYAPIATHNDNNHSASRTEHDNLPLGARLRLRRSVDVASRCGENSACVTIGRALQEYGMYLVDTAGRPVLYAEGLYGKDLSWDGLLDSHDVGTFDAWDFEVLEIPGLIPTP